MTNQFIEIELGRKWVHLTQWKRGQLVCEYTEALPDHYLADGEPVSVEALGRWLKTIAADHGFRGRKCRIVLPLHKIYLRMVNYPPMSHPQIRLNLPYEFRDYISGNMEQYHLEYTVAKRKSEETEAPMEIMAAAVAKDVLEMMKTLADCAGWKVKEITASPFLYSGRIRESEKNSCLIALNAETVMVYFYKGSHLVAYREIEREYGYEELSTLVIQTVEFYLHRYPQYQPDMVGIHGDMEETECLGRQITEQLKLPWKPAGDWLAMTEDVKPALNLRKKTTILKNPGKIAVFLLLIFLGIGILGRYGIQMPLEHRERSQQELQYIKTEVERYKEQNQDYQAVADEYRICFATYLTREEENLTDRTECVRAIISVLEPYGRIRSLSMIQSECQVQVEGMLCSQIADLTKDLRMSSLAASTEVTQVEKNSKEQTVTVDLLIRIREREEDEAQQIYNSR